MRRLSSFLLQVLYLLWVCHKWLYVKVHSLYTHFDKSFDHERMLDFVNVFSASMEMIMCFFYFFFVNVMYDVD